MALLAINWNPDRRTLRRFGLVCLVVFGALGAWACLRRSVFGIGLSPEAAQAVAIAFWAAAGLAGVLACVAPAVLRFLYVALTALTLPIGFVVSHTALALLYYGVVTPIALVGRLAGRDPLHRAFDPDAASYWAPRKGTPDVKRYFRQF